MGKIVRKKRVLENIVDQLRCPKCGSISFTAMSRFIKKCAGCSHRISVKPKEKVVDDAGEV